MHRNNNRAKRKKMNPKQLAEYVKKNKEYHEYQTYNHAKNIEASRAMLQSIEDAQYVVAHVLPPELYREMYEDPSFDPQVEYSNEVLYTEQMYRIFPKEMYAGKFGAVELGRMIEKHSGPPNETDIIHTPNEGIELLDEVNRGGNEEIDYDALRKYRLERLEEAVAGIKTDYTGEIGLKPTMSGEDEPTTESEEHN